MLCEASRVARIRSNGVGLPPCWMCPRTTSRASNMPSLSCSKTRQRKSVEYIVDAFSLRTARNSRWPILKEATIRSTSSASCLSVMPSSCRYTRTAPPDRPPIVAR